MSEPSAFFGLRLCVLACIIAFGTARRHGRGAWVENMDENIGIIKEKLLSSFRFYAVGEGHSIVRHIRDLRSNSKPNPEKKFVAEGIWMTNLLDYAGLRLRAELL